MLAAPDAAAGDPRDGLGRADLERDVSDFRRCHRPFAIPQRQVRAAVDVHQAGVPLRHAHPLQERSVVGDLVAVGDGVQCRAPLDPAIGRRPRRDPIAPIRHAPRAVEVEREGARVVQRDEPVVPVEHEREAGLVRGIHDRSARRAVVSASDEPEHRAIAAPLDDPAEPADRVEADLVPRRQHRRVGRREAADLEGRCGIAGPLRHRVRHRSRRAWPHGEVEALLEATALRSAERLQAEAPRLRAKAAAQIDAQHSALRPGPRGLRHDRHEATIRGHLDGGATG